MGLALHKEAVRVLVVLVLVAQTQIEQEALESHFGAYPLAAVVPDGRVEPEQLLLVAAPQVQEQVLVLVMEILAPTALVVAVVAVKKVDQALSLFVTKQVMQHVHPHKALLILIQF
jgi:hypothetical protein